MACVTLCLYVHIVKGKWLELLMSNLIAIWSMHVLTPTSKGHRSYTASLCMHVDRTAWTSYYYDDCHQY